MSVYRCPSCGSLRVVCAMAGRERRGAARCLACATRWIQVGARQLVVRSGRLPERPHPSTPRR